MADTTVYAGDAARWQAVCRRDPAAADAFCYAVLTTGVYCRPGCASRLPRRENVRFFDTPEQAGEAGYRPCKRCRPQRQAASHRHLALLIELCRCLEQAEERVSLAQLAAQTGISASHLQRLFSGALGVSPRQYQNHQRMVRFRQRLAEGGSVTEAMQWAGFSSTSRLYEQAAEGLGMVPGEYRDGAPGVVIQHAAIPCFLGWVLVGLTDRGICAVEFGDLPDKLRERLGERFPHARLEAAEAGQLALVERVVSQVEYPAAEHGLPLDIVGSAFQQQVWRALASIPPGERISYSELARRAGHPRAARAAGSACAVNPVALLVPCHRAVRSDGDLSRYRWGVARKARLLEREARQASRRRGESEGD